MKYEVENWERIIKKRIPNERRWYNCKIHEITQIKYEIIELLSKEFNIKSLCLIMKVSRSGYYKWLKNKENLNNYELNRKDLGILIKDIHTRKPSYGYHRINAIIRRELAGLYQTIWYIKYVNC